jgi:uncharacterized protein (DUF4415 family)
VTWWRKSANQRNWRGGVLSNLWLASEDRVSMYEFRAEVPDAWHMIEADIDCHAPKQKVTLILDAPVAKAFKAMGQGYQTRINRILATYLEMKVGHLLEVEVVMLKDR